MNDVVTKGEIGSYPRREFITETLWTEETTKGEREEQGQKLLPILRQRRLWMDPMKKDFISVILAFTWD